MKKLLLLLLLFTGISNAQSEYNKNTTFGDGKTFDVWNKFETDIYLETFVNEQTPVGLMHTHNELKKVLVFYRLTDKELIKNEVLLPSYISDITDFSNLSNAAYISSAEINKAWVVPNQKLMIVFSVTKDSNSVNIIKDSK